MSKNINFRLTSTCFFLATVLSFVIRTSCMGQTSDPTSQLVENLKQRDQTMKAVRCLGTETFFNPEAVEAEKDIQRRRTQGEKVGMIGNGTYQFAAAFDDKMEVMAGGRAGGSDHMQGVAYDKKNTFEKLVRGSREIYDRQSSRYYNVDVSMNTQINHDDEKGKKTFPGLRANGWEIPFTREDLAKALTDGKYHFVARINDEQWGETLEYSGTYRFPGYDYHYEVKFRIAPQFNFLVVSGEKNDSKTVETYRTRKMAQISGFWLPTETFQDAYQSAGGKKVLQFTDQFQFDHFVVGELPEDFWKKQLRFERWVDGKTGNYYRVTPEGDKILIPMNNQITGQVAFGWLYIVSVSALLIVTVAGYVRWKRLQLSKPV